MYLVYANFYDASQRKSFILHNKAINFYSKKKNQRKINLYFILCLLHMHTLVVWIQKFWWKIENWVCSFIWIHCKAIKSCHWRELQYAWSWMEPIRFYLLGWQMWLGWHLIELYCTQCEEYWKPLKIKPVQMCFRSYVMGATEKDKDELNITTRNKFLFYFSRIRHSRFVAHKMDARNFDCTNPFDWVAFEGDFIFKTIILLPSTKWFPQALNVRHPVLST